MAPNATRTRFAARFATYLGLGCLLLAARAEAAVEGRAFAAYVFVPSAGVSPVTLVDSGLLPASGGVLGDSAAIASAGSAVWLVSPASRTEGDGCRGTSRSVMGNGSVLANTPAAVTFDAISSRDDDECCKPRNPGSITSSIANLVFAGQPVVVTGQPNQVVNIPGVGTLTVNEVVLLNPGNCGDSDYQLNALDLQLPGGGQVIVGSARFNSLDHCCSTRSKASTWGSVKVRYR